MRVRRTEFYAMIAIIAGILVAAAIGRDGAPDFFRADRAWLYVTIVASAYMVSRGLAKSGLTTATATQASASPRRQSSA